MNVERILAFAKKEKGGPVMRLEGLKAEYGHDFDGTNFYYGINETNKKTFEHGGNALNGTHTAFFNDMRDALLGGEANEKIVVLGLEPPQVDAPYLFVDANLNLVTQLAVELNTYQRSAAENGKVLRIVIRYASEMNDRKLSSAPNAGNRYAGDPESYKRSFQTVREVFRNNAPNVEFAFSPAIRRDLMEPGLSAYWPGDSHVDVISCTWYIGSENDFKRGAVFFQSYILHREMKGKPFGIDELGGCETVGPGKGKNNDAFLQRMFEKIVDLEDEGIRFSYVTIFLESKWGTDAKLKWLPDND